MLKSKTKISGSQTKTQPTLALTVLQKKRAASVIYLKFKHKITRREAAMIVDFVVSASRPIRFRPFILQGGLKRKLLHKFSAGKISDKMIVAYAKKPKPVKRSTPDPGPSSTQ